MSILFDQARQFKSSLYEVARGVLRSRERLTERNQEQACEIKRLSEKNEQLTRRAKQREQRLLETQQENEMLRCENDRQERTFHFLSFGNWANTQSHPTGRTEPFHPAATKAESTLHKPGPTLR